MIGTFWICVHLILVGILHDGDAITRGFVPLYIINRINMLPCGGAVLDEHHILTAAYCVNGWNSSDIFVLAGAISQTGLGGQVHRIWMGLAVPPFLRNTRSKNDIAVLRLTKSLHLGDTIVTVQLPPRNDPLPVDRRLIYSGWGETDYTIEKQLRYNFVMILPSRWYLSCRENEFSAKFNFWFAHANIGDIGGPLVEFRRSIVYGIAFDAELHLGGRIFFTKVSSHLPFIQNAMSDD